MRDKRKWAASLAGLLAAACVLSGCSSASAVKKTAPEPVNAAASTQIWNFNYTGKYQTFTAPDEGKYKLEVWGAAAGRLMQNHVLNSSASRGGYSTGTISLNKGDVLYVSVGGQGQNGIYQGDAAGGWNGGAKGNWDHSDDEATGGSGGATSIQTTLKGDGQLKNYESVKDTDVVIVAGGAGSGGETYTYLVSASYGGGESGGKGTYASSSKGQTTAYAGTQIAGYAFGRGEDGVHKNTNSEVGAGGGGWYGGHAGNDTAANTYVGGAGGSGHISSLLADGETIAGNQKITEPDGSSNTGHYGNGYARITKLASDYEFIGWNTDKDGNGKTFQEGQNIGKMTKDNPEVKDYLDEDGNLDLYAQWVLESKDFHYTGAVQTFTVPVDGTYKLETWGASSGCFLGDSVLQDGNIGLGGYSSGFIHLTKGQTLYIAVGGKGQDGILRGDASGGWNGGGSGSWDHSDDEATAGGGGATSIQISLKSDGQLKNYSSAKDNVLLVAGGGGSSSRGSGAAHGGGTSGISIGAAAGTQSSGYAFGVGGSAVHKKANSELGAGGGGWYGGYAMNDAADYTYNGGAGGSGHVGAKMLNGSTIAGNQSFASISGRTEKGHSGNGYARITLLNTEYTD